MRFVYFGYDFMLGSVHRLIEDGHTLIGIFTFECDNIFNFNKQTYELAQSLRIPITETPPSPEDIDRFLDDKCEIFLAAGYPHLIPSPPPESAYALNFHPSLLPKGRGIMPTPYIITQHPEAAGATIHKMENDFDTGDILLQTAFEIEEHETVETLSARIALAAPEMLLQVFNNIEDMWRHALPQNHDDALHFPPPDDDMRTLKWTQSVQTIDKTARAFGRYGSLAIIEDQTFVVYNHSVWRDNHGFEPGQIACQMSRELIVTALDGYVCLKEFQLVNLGHAQ